jgi:hypothetical protein
MASWISMVAALAGLLLGGVVTYLTTSAQLRAEAEHAYDRALRDLRLPHYQQLFHLTEGIPRQWRMSDAPSRVELLALREQFHNWYFSDQAGGMFLSQAARDAYFLLQNHLQSAAAHLTDDSQPVGEERLSQPPPAGQRTSASTLSRSWRSRTAASALDRSPECATAPLGSALRRRPLQS